MMTKRINDDDDDDDDGDDDDDCPPTEVPAARLNGTLLSVAAVNCRPMKCRRTNYFRNV